MRDIAGAVLETLPGGAQAKYLHNDHLSFAAAGANAFALEKYVQVQILRAGFSRAGGLGFAPPENFELLHALRSILVHFGISTDHLFC